MMAARAKVMSQNSSEALKAWTQDGKATSAQATPVQKAGALYAATLAHLQLRNASEAERTANALSGVVSSLVLPGAPQQEGLRLVTLLRAEVASKNDRFAEALKTLDSLNPKALPRPELMATAEALLRLPEQAARQKVTQLLREQVTLNPHDAQAWSTLARLLALQGHILPSLRAEGEAQMARMDWSGAVDRFRAAQDWAKNNRLQAGDHIEASIVDARLRLTQALVREMQTER
jgi:predicted Zn-dependent protease